MSKLLLVVKAALAVMLALLVGHMFYFLGFNHGWDLAKQDEKAKWVLEGKSCPRHIQKKAK